MGDTKPKIWNRPETLHTRIRRVVDSADVFFWNQLAAAFPECTTGDIAPPDADRVRLALEAAADTWVETNRPMEASRVAERVIRVVLRLPRRGERMWWVSGENAHDPEAALAEVLRESEELGFPAGRDITSDDSPDDHEMVAVTIEIVKVQP